MKNSKKTPKASKQAAESSSLCAHNANQTSVEYWLNVARENLDSENMEGAIEAYRHATKLDPDCEFWVELGERYLDNRQLGMAMEAYEQASKLGSSKAFCASYWEWRGQTLEACHDYNGALEAYSKWAQADQKSIKPLDKTGALLVLQELWTDLPVLRSQYIERSSYKSGSDDDPDPEVLESMALYAYFLEKELGSAEDPSAKELAYAALRGKYDSAAMRYLLGSIYYDLERWDSADKEFERALKLLEKNPEWCEHRFNLNWTAVSAKLMRGRIAARQHRHQNALELFTDCVEKVGERWYLDPLASEVRCTFMRFLMSIGQVDEVLHDLQSLSDALGDTIAREMNALSLEVKENGGEITLSQDLTGSMFADALTSWRHALLFEGYIKTGQYDNAKVELDILKSDKEDDDDEDESLNERPEAPAEENIRELLESLQDCTYKDALAKLRLYCRRHPQSAQAPAQLAQLILEKSGQNQHALMKSLQKLLEQHPENIELLKLAEEFYRSAGLNSQARLMYINRHALQARTAHKPICEWLTPAPLESSGLLFAISARAFPGSGKLAVTGLDESLSTYAQITASLIRAEQQTLGVSDLDSVDMHVHVRVLGEKEIPLSQFTQSLQQNRGESELHLQDILGESKYHCDENIGLALFAAMLSALKHKLPQKVTILSGSVDLHGNIETAGDVAPSFKALANYEDACWERIILPEQLAPVLIKGDNFSWCDIDDMVLIRHISQAIEHLDL